MVAVQGRLQTRSWDDAQGQKKWRTEIVAHRVDFLPGGGKATGEGGASAPLPF
jgi:single-strand DNA-binding protein